MQGLVIDSLNLRSETGTLSPGPGTQLGPKTRDLLVHARREAVSAKGDAPSLTTPTLSPV